LPLRGVWGIEEPDPQARCAWLTAGCRFAAFDSDPALADETMLKNTFLERWKFNDTSYNQFTQSIRYRTK